MNLSAIIDIYFIKQPKLRRFVTALLERNRDLDVAIAGTNLHINSHREHGYLRASRILKHNATLRDEYPVLMNFFSLIRDGDVFVDVGANVGLFTHSIARLTRLYPGLKLIAFEANPDTFKRLSAKKVAGVDFFNLAVSDKEGELEFVDGAVSHVFTTVDKQNQYSIPGETIKVQAKPLDSLIDTDKPVILKIDVEGQELNVLKGATRLFASGVIRVVYLDGYDDPSINDFLLEKGFSLYNGKTLERVSGRVFSLLAIKDGRRFG